MKIVILDGYALNPGDLSWDFLKEFGSVTYYDRTSGEDLTVSRIGDGDIVLLNKTAITETVLARCPNLKLICVLATGYNVVDYVAAAKRGIPVCNIPGYGTDSVAQFTFALLLELCHQIGLHDRSVHAGDWTACPDFCYWKTPQMELAGKTLGIIGYGSIGQAVAKIAQSFSMNILAYSRTHRPGHEYCDLDTLLAGSDVVTLHCPLFPETEGIINADTIAKMKDGAILLNTARGPLIDEAAVADALRSGKLRGAAMDVVCSEPILKSSPLLTAPNCIITPHMAWAPIEARQRILDIVANNIRGFLTGKPQNIVNM
ncbi:MAG: D-2-hydroxyacid dehydrogenase [Ruminococcaceae bacterium]|nr:D-2-hydroxyacid dehydrogenase [Oscillospiraceae bacterium]